ncbi:expressed unknown protein [Seminavis robusta]|uniref:FTP domain-containing protein n=1 Tax=Seminavis robusta TaxID=568900 RepID=A0A9N8HVQ0_9STRA|nr:expressed unknown protein [Seminavis robusta]|eukprot:Sro1846_g301380.1 n/a (299) ;mRNA; f:15211-16107
MTHNNKIYSVATTGLLGLLLAQQGAAVSTPNFLPEQDQLERNQALWEGLGFQSYQLEYERVGTNLPSTYPFPWAVTVNSPHNPGVITGVDASFNNIPSSVPLPSMESLFTLIQNEIDANTDLDIEVQYDTTKGFPANIHFVRSDGSIYGVQVTHFVPLGGSNTPGPTPTSAQQQLNQAVALWKSMNILKYAYDFNMFGPNPQNIVFPWTITVSNGVQVTAMDGNSNQINWVNNNPHPMSFDELFTMIQSAINQSPKYLEVSYNQQYGYPVDIYIVYDDTTADATVDAKISDFSLPVGR